MAILSDIIYSVKLEILAKPLKNTCEQAHV